MNEKHIYWVIPVMIILSVLIGIGLSMSILSHNRFLVDFCEDRGYDNFADIYTGTNYNNEKSLWISCAIDKTWDSEYISFEFQEIKE